MFSKNHYINWISLSLTGLVNSLFLYNIFPSYSLLLPILFFTVFITIIVFADKRYTGAKETFVKLFIVLFSPAVYYLIFIEYGILVNTALFIFLIFLSEKYIPKQGVMISSFIVAFLFGVLLSAAPVFWIIYMVYTLYLFRSDLLLMILFIAVTAVVYIVLILTYKELSSSTFYPGGPFEIRSVFSFIPVWISIFILIAGIYAGWLVSDLQEVFFAGGLMLLIPALILIIIKAIQIQEFNTITAVLYMSYCAVTIPFFALAMKDYEVDRFLGKKLKTYNQTDYP